MLDPLNTNVLVKNAVGAPQAETKVEGVSSVEKANADFSSDARSASPSAEAGVSPAVRLEISDEGLKLAQASAFEPQRNDPSLTAGTDQRAELPPGQKQDNLGVTEDAGRPMDK